MNSEDPVVVAFTTCPSREVGERLAETLVEDALAACVNCIGGLTSIYRWQGKTERDTECLLMIKTTSQRLDALKSRVKELHPYELPEFIAIPVCAGAEKYLAWVRDSVQLCA